MKKALLILMISSALIIGSIVPAMAGLLDFETPQTDADGLMLDEYGGFNWLNMYVVDGATEYPSPDFLGSGYENGVVSGSQVAFNGFAEVTMISSDKNFDFYSAYFVAAWNNGLNVTIEGYNDGALAYTKNITVDTTGPENFCFNFIDIDQLRLSSWGGNDAGLGGEGTHFAMDDLTFCANCNPVPIPTTLILLGTGLAGIAGIRKKKGQKQI